MSEGVRDRRVWAKRLFAAALAVVLTLGAAEALLRWLEPPQYAPRTAQFGFTPLDGARDDGRDVWALTPLSRVRFAWDGDPYGVLPEGAVLECAINARGLRGPLPPFGKPAVLFLGDSFTFGEGVLEPDTFVRRLEAGSGAYAAVNAGISGYGSREQSARVAEWLGAFRPKAVVLVYNLNDPIALGKSLTRADRFMNVGGGTRSSIRVLGLVNSVLEDGAEEAWYRGFYQGPGAAAWERTRREIGAMRAATEAQGARFGVAIFPLLHELDDYPFADLHEQIARDLRAGGADVLDLLPAFAGQPTDQLWVHPTDHHPNAAGHEIAAKALAPFVDDLLRR